MVQSPKRNFMYDKNTLAFRTVQIIGILPFTMNADGKFQYQRSSILALFSLFLTCSTLIYFITMTYIYATSSMWQQIELSFDEGAFLFVVILNTIVPLLVPVFFLELRKIKDFLNECKEFQTHYERSIGTELSPSSSQLIAILSILFAICMCLVVPLTGLDQLSILLRLKGHINIYYLDTIFSILSIWTVCGVFLLWSTFNRGLRHAADCLISQLKHEKDLSRHYKLWLDLRGLCQQLGDSFSYSLLFICGIMFATGLPALYFAARNMNEGNFQHLFAPFASIYAITCVVENGYRTVKKLGGTYSMKISAILVENSSGNSIYDHELIALIENISQNPPKMSVGSFFAADRNINIPMYSSLLTYLVIMAQFKMDTMKDV